MKKNILDKKPGLEAASRLNPNVAPEPKKRYRIYRNAEYETTIMFDPMAVSVDTLSDIRQDVFDGSGGRIYIIAGLANHGYLQIIENTALTPGLFSLTMEDAIEMITNKIDGSVIY